MGLQLVTAPAQEPIGLDLAKAHLRVSGSDEDEVIRLYMASARGQVESFLARSLITQTWALTLDRFPASDREAIKLPRPPLVSVGSIVYLDCDGAEQTWPDESYVVDAASWSPRVMPAYGVTWPSTRSTVNAVTVTYTAGYGAGGDAVPQVIRNEILMLTADLYGNRGDMPRAAVASALSSSAALWAYRVVEF